MTSVLDTVIVGYWIARPGVDAARPDLDETMRIRAAATIAVDMLWPLLRPEQRAELEGERDDVIALLVARVEAGKAATDPANAA